MYDMKHSLLSSAAFCLLFSACAPTPVTPVEVTPVASVTVGQPCNVQTDSDVDTKGMQCHWYGEVDDRKAVWIVPEIPFPHPGDYTVFMGGWKTFTSADKSFSVKYPPTGLVETANLDSQGYVRVLHAKPVGDAGVGVLIENLQADSLALENSIKEIALRSGAVRRTDDFDMNGVTAIRLDSVPKGSLGPDHIDIFVPRDDYYIHLAASTFGKSSGEPFYDAFSEAVISSFVAK